MLDAAFAVPAVKLAMLAGAAISRAVVGENFSWLAVNLDELVKDSGNEVSCY